MDYRDVVVALTELSPDARTRALAQLRSATDEELTRARQIQTFAPPDVLLV